MKLSTCLFRIVLYACLFLHGTFLFALDVPPLKGPVNDYAQLFTESELQKLNTFLYSIDQNNALQIAVLTVPSLQGESIEDYSIRVAEQWKIGEKGKDNGVILVIAAQDRKLRIEVGYGLEELLTDAKSSKIIRSVIAPQFQKHEYGAGVLLGIKSIAGIVLQEESLVDEAVQESERRHDDSIPLPVIIFLIIIYLFGSRFMPGSWFWPLLFLSAGRRSSGFSGHGGGRGFSGGSGFSGGGGRFGGGGSSGSW